MPLLWPETGAPHRVHQVLVYGMEDADLWVDISDEIETKISALKQHASQMGDWDPAERIRERNAAIGKEKGLAFAESYRVFTLVPPDSD